MDVSVADSGLLKLGKHEPYWPVENSPTGGHFQNFPEPQKSEGKGVERDPLIFLCFLPVTA